MGPKALFQLLSPYMGFRVSVLGFADVGISGVLGLMSCSARLQGLGVWAGSFAALSLHQGDKGSTGGGFKA